jgi:hypothetical protein
VLPLRPVVVALLFMDEPGDLLLLGGPELMEPSDLGGAMAGAAVVAAVEKNKRSVMTHEK